jgi:copper chaperone NosL
MRPAMLRAGVLSALVLLLASCAKGPEAVHWGVEECAHCQMSIGDERYAGQVVDRRGMTYKFDALECMAAFMAGGELPAAGVHSVWVADGRDGWTPAAEASFLHSDGIRSPMGGGYAAYATVEAARAMHAEVGGELLRWQDVLERVTAAGHEHADGAAGH